MAVEGNIKVMIIDDDNDDYLIISDYLKNIANHNFKIDWCYNYKTALENICNNSHNIYLVDYRLGAKTGLDLIKEANAQNCDTPIILLTGRGHKELDIVAIQAGATDYLIKADLNSEKLERSIRYALERKEALRALRDNEKKYRNIFERSKDAVFLATDELVFVDANPATSEMLEFDINELKTVSLNQLLTDDATKIKIKNLLRDHEDAIDIEVEINTKNNEKKSCILSFTYQRSGDNKLLVQGILHDITTLKRNEKANLQIQKLAATGRLVRTLAHEVRNPLNNINMSVEQLLDETEDEEEKTYLDIIQRNMLRIDKLIAELLDSSRPTELEFADCSLQEVLEESLAMAVDRLTLQNMKLIKDITAEPLIISADKEKLKIAFVNFFVNAIEAMQPNSGVLQVSLQSAPSGKTVIIKDNGLGISEENLARLFEPYFTTKRNGVGLGLASTLNILQQHKANIDVQSVIDKGTTFTISFN